MSVRAISTALLCAALAACGGSENPSSVAGNSKLLEEAKGRWLLINYWAEWCKPCLAELPELNEFQRRYGDRALVYAVNFDGVSGAALQQQIEKYRIEVPVLSEDPAATLGFKRPAALPSTYVFKPDGTLHTTLQGQQTLDSLAAAIGQATAAAEPAQ